MIDTGQRSSLLATVRTEVDDFLHKYFTEKIQDSSQIDSQYRELWVAISRLSNAGGKRLRPYMTILAYESFSGQDHTSLIPIAASQELLHLSMLVHDDIIDRDLIRYGVKNIQGYYKDRYATLARDPQESDHFAASAALMAGDLLLSSAYEVTQRSKLKSDDIIKAQRYLSAAVFSVVGGELLDTEAPLRKIKHVDTEQIALFKTASYSFNAPLLTGATLAGADENSISELISFGEALGVAYQFKDDLLGVFGDDEVTGKSNLSDLAEAKRTLLLQEAFRRSTPAQLAVLERLIGKHDLTNADADEVRDVMIASGAKVSVENIIDAHRDSAIAALARIEMPDRYRQEFEALVVKATRRDT